MSKVSTKTGDLGETSLKGGKRVPKTDLRIETNGCLDELNCVIGMVRAELSTDDERHIILKDIQLDIMRIMSFVAGLPEIQEVPVLEVKVGNLEKEIDNIEKDIKNSEYFVLPGGTRISSLFHFARVTARKAERTLCRLKENNMPPQSVYSFINRLSDLFFLMARQELQDAGIPEERWKIFSSRQKKD